MLSNEFLYGTSYVPRVPIEICQARLDLLNKNLKSVPIEDNYRIIQIHRAIRFWEYMRDNIEGEDR